MKNKKRLVDAVAGKKLFCAIAKPAEYKGVIHMVVPISEIDKLPTIDATEVVHSKWSDEQWRFECDHCHKWFVLAEGNADMNYCPNCGARMDGDIDG